MGRSPQLPQKAREALGLPLRGPLPRSVRYRGQVEQAERALVGAMPKAVAVMVSLMDDPDPRTRAAAAGYILDRVLGKAAPATKPPAEDNKAPPVTESDARVMVRSLLQGVTPGTASRVQEMLVADLRAQGRILPGGAPSPANE